MNIETMLPRVMEFARRADAVALKDLSDLCIECVKGDVRGVLPYITEGASICERSIANGSGDVRKLYELHRRFLHVGAPYDLDCYMQFLEFNRDPAQKFYVPRRGIMRRLTDALQRLTYGDLDELVLSMPPRVGKLLSDDTPVLTTDGWKNHGDLKVGDYVFSPSGEPVPVIGVLPKNQTTHTVTFSDGSKIECHFRHEWRVHDRRFGKTRIMETHEMIGHLENGAKYGNKRGHRYNFQIEGKEPIFGVDIDLPVPPYTLGAWLGDGTNKQPRITGDKADAEIIERITEDGFSISKVYTHKTTGVITTEFCSDFRKKLNQIGMCFPKERKEKHIPHEYLIAPIEQRLALLAGLLDTDGCLRRKEHRYQFSTTEKQLADDFISLIATFGWRISVKIAPPRLSSGGVDGKKDCYVISFNPTMFIPCVLERKQLRTFSKQRKLSIVKIEESEPKQGNCITVFGGMYLAGRKMIPTHNTTVLMFYTTWLLGRDSERSNLYSAYSDTITAAFYAGCLEVMTDPVTYLWKEVFPYASIVATNAKEETLNVDRKKRYPSLTCRSLYGTLNGACDCDGILISDDLIGGIEEALNKDRLESAWSKVDNNLIPRAKEGAKILWCGTRWSIADPAGRRMDLVLGDERFKGRRVEIINLPALNENDESNFKYAYGVGFSTEYYKMRRASFERNNDLASWLAQYQGEPIERSGALFEPGDMRFYNGVLPDESELVRKFMAVDPAYGGGDYTSAPVCYQYADGSVYVVDVVFDDGDKRITQPLIAKKIEEHGLNAVRFEVTKSTMGYKDDIEKILHNKNIRVNIMTKSAPNNTSKEMRIFDKAPEIREFYFLEDGKRSKEYSLFMQNVFSFKMLAKNKHDDAPDSLAMAADMVKGTRRTFEVVERPF